MFNTLLEALYFIAPAGIAQLFAFFVVILNLPDNEPINVKFFGLKETWYGIIAGSIGAVFTLIIQSYFYDQEFFYSISILDYSSLNIIVLGLIFAFGSIGGNLIKAFFKQKLGKKENENWFPFDQLDYVLGTLLLFSLIYFSQLPVWYEIITLLIAMPFVHLSVSFLGYVFRLKNEWR